MEGTDITRADMVIMMDMAKDRVHMAMKTKKMSRTMTDIAKETGDTVRRADMAMETVDM